MNIVIVGHVDHGKSTVIGRLLADTDSLPDGKMKQVKERCEKESREFEYAFLLDALKDEQSQGITIDTARCFFKTEKRDYLILDAPGHIEFLKNMVSGTARAEAAILVIDAKEGVKENSKRHGYLLSMLGIEQVIVCVNKMDLADYDNKAFEKIVDEYSSFLKKIGIEAKEFIPVCALNGDNIAGASKKMSWFKGNSILSALDSFEKAPPLIEKPFRMPVQDVYRFTGDKNGKRIVAGRVESGSLKEGTEIVFLPSGKQSKIKTIEEFGNKTRKDIFAGCSMGVTLEEQVYVPRGEIMCIASEKPAFVSSTIKANIFWMGKEPMIKDKEYFLKLGTARVAAKLGQVFAVMDTSNLSKTSKEKIDRHDISECQIECASQIAFDQFNEIKATGRFVIVDEFDIAGGGIITELVEDSQGETREQVIKREGKWEHGLVSYNDRVTKYGHSPKLIILTGKSGVDKKSIAKQLEKKLFENGRIVYFLGIGNLLRGLDADISKSKRDEHIRRLGEVSHILMDAGVIVVATASDLGEDDLRLLETVTNRESVFIVNVGKESLEDGLVDLDLDPSTEAGKNIEKIVKLLKLNPLA
ncbi:MAG: GTP-binding protein [archaeon]|jgi:bifunctional enzyme CysN/CysC|nr:GTP-binding protein [archaeon]